MTTTGLYFHPYPRTGLDFSNGGLDKLAKAFFGHDIVKTSDFSFTENSNITKTENATTFQGVLEHFQANSPDMLCVVRRKRGFFIKKWENYFQSE